MKKLYGFTIVLILISSFSYSQYSEQDYINALNIQQCGTSDVSGSYIPAFPVDNDTLRVLVVYARYPDDTWDPGGTGQATNYWPGNLGNQKPYWSDDVIKSNTLNIGNSNITAYYRDASLGKFYVIGDVYPNLYIFQNNSEYYRTNGRHIGWAVGELLTNIAPNVDWNLYDKFAPNDPVDKRHPDGQIDCIMVLFRFLMSTEPLTNSGIAGLGGSFANFGPYGTSIRVMPSKKIITSDLCWSYGSGLIAQMLYPWNYNIACHELGHYLVGEHRNNMGYFNLMNTNGNSFICSEEREYLGWATPTNVSQSGTYYLSDYGTTGQYLRILKGGYYYYLENRRRINYHLSNQWTNWPYHNYQPLWPMSRDSGLFVYRRNNETNETPISANGKWDWQKSDLYPSSYLVNLNYNNYNYTTFFYDKPNRLNGETVFDLVGKQAVDYQTGQTVGTKSHCSAGGDSNICFDVGYNQVLSPWSNPTFGIINPSDSFAVEILGKANDGSMIVNIYFENMSQTNPSKPQSLRVYKEYLPNSEAFHPLLTWYKNNEPDLQKYKIYRAQVMTPGVDPTNYSYVGETTDTIFIDEAITLYRRGGGTGACTYVFKKYSYKVTAYDLTAKESVKSERDSIYGYADPCAPLDMPYGNDPNNDVNYRYNLYQNYPNPFNPITNIKYSLPKSGIVTLKVYNAIGQVVKVLVNELKEAGEYIVSFDSSNLPSGIYYYKIDFNNTSITKKMLLIK